MGETIAEALLREGREEGRQEGKREVARESILILGRKRFGEPDEQTQAAIVSIKDVAQLKAMLARALDVSSRQELLQPPQD